MNERLLQLAARQGLLKARIEAQRLSLAEQTEPLETALARGDIQAVLNYRSQAPGALRAHPTEDHFLPIFFALGAAGDDLHAHYLSREVMYSMLSMDAFAMEPMPEGRLA